LHQVGTSSLLIYMMHGHTYIKLRLPFFLKIFYILIGIFISRFHSPWTCYILFGSTVLSE